jgi:uncharacterized protein YifE (UPF0438 family)
MNESKFIWKKRNRFCRSMVSGLFVALMMLVGDGAFSVVNAQQPPPPPQSCRNATKACAEFERIWVDYDVTENGVRGMRIHTKFSVYRMKGVAAALAVYFETGDAKRLRDKNKRFYTTGGDVTIQRELKIDYDPGVYSDLAVFMPYDELDLDEGEYDLKMDVDLIYLNGTLIQHLAFHDFNFKQPARARLEAPMPTQQAPMPMSIEDSGSNNGNSSAPNASMEKVWIDYDVTENGRKGMRIHVKFRVQNLKNVESDLRIRVARQNDALLKGVSAAYSNTDGELTVTRKLKPGFDATVYEDETVFLPYQEINLGRGVFNLKLDVDVTYRSGELIKHLGWHEFTFRNGVN